nr:glycosyltransferase [uncultured Pseudomonas sp.]
MTSNQKTQFKALQEITKKIKKSGAFDEIYYLSQFEKNEKKPSNAIKHYLLRDWNTGYNPHPCFDGKFYYENNTDIQKVNMHPFLHFVLYGHNEARYTREDFFLPRFKEEHPEINGQSINPFQHYTKVYGQKLPLSRKEQRKTDSSAPEQRPHKSNIIVPASIEHSPIFESFNTRPELIGRIDVLKNGRIAGWAINLSSREEVLEVEVIINGVPYQTKPLSVERPDVALIYPGNPLCGFDFNIPDHSISLERYSVSLRIKGTQTYLSSRVLNTIVQKNSKKSTTPKQTFNASTPDITIIIPIYNAASQLQECIESVIRYTNLSTKVRSVILSDDASPDPEIRKILDLYSKRNKFTVISHDQNVGYTENINQAIAQTNDTDIVLLNSDTRVTPNWLEMMQRAVLQSSFIGTGSAVSDNAGAFSVPNRNTTNVLPTWFTEEEYGRLITHTSTFQHSRLPTTSGFCMYIKRAVIDSIGLFDSLNFPRGYGEENDFCMRAGHVGWEHILVDNVIVYHERSASFKDAKASLIAKANSLIPAMYPEYNEAVAQAFVKNNELSKRRFDITYNRIRYQKSPRPRVAYVIGVESGGTPQTNMDLMSTIQHDYEPYLLLCTTTHIKIYKIYGTERIELESINLKYPVTPITHDSPSYKVEIADILQRYAFEIVHIRHIGRHGISLISIAKSLDIKVIFSLHDFYTLCPNVKLLDAENNFCGGTCTSGGADCNVELWNSSLTPRLKDSWVHSWRNVFQHLLAKCDALVTTSPYARGLVKSIYDIDSVRFDVIPHARDFSEFDESATIGTLNITETIKVFIPGHIVPAKGLELIKAVKKIDTKNQIEFHFAGILKEDLSEYGTYHGPYKREEFSKLVKKISPHIGGVFSIWPETYSHTLTELWSCGLPVLTSKYGATGERLTQHGGGWIVDEMNAENVLNILLKLVEEPEEIFFQKQAVVNWQKNYGKNYTIPVMTACYKQLYSEMLDLKKDTRKTVFLVPFGAQSDVLPVPTAHLQPTLDNIYGRCIISTWPSSTIDVLEHLTPPDILVIKYHEESKAVDTNSLISVRRLFPGVRFFLEIAADSSIIKDSSYEECTHPTLVWLLRNAEHILVPPQLENTVNYCRSAHDLTAMLRNAEDKHLLPMPQNNKAQYFGHNAIGYDHVWFEGLLKQVNSSTASVVNKDNAIYIAANFTLIDWSALSNHPRKLGLISIIIPNFDKVGITEKLLKTLTSITRSKHDYEIIIVENGSRPEVRYQIEELAKTYPKTKVVCTATPLMFSVGCNYGAAHASGEYFLFLNNDMEVLHESWLDRLVTPLLEHDDIGIVGGKLLYEDGTIQHAGLVFSKISNMAYHAYLGEEQSAEHVNRHRQMQAVTGACLGIRASDFIKLRGFNPLYINGCEDVDLCLRMHHLLNRKTVYVPDSVILHLEGKSPGRGKHVLANRLIFNTIWHDHISPDDASLYDRDGFNVSSYQVDSEWLKPEYRSIKATLTKKLSK